MAHTVANKIRAEHSWLSVCYRKKLCHGQWLPVIYMIKIILAYNTKIPLN